MCSFPSLSSALEFVCNHQQVLAMKSLIANGFVFVVIVIQPFPITCNSNRIEKKSHIVQPRTVREIPIYGGRQSHCFRHASVIVQNKVLYFITYRIWLKERNG